MKPDNKTISLPDALHRRLKLECAKRAVKIKEAVAVAIAAWIGGAK